VDLFRGFIDYLAGIYGPAPAYYNNNCNCRFYFTMTGPAENDTSFRAETPEGIEYTLYPAGICARFCAYSIDFFIKGLVIVVFSVVYSIFMRSYGGLWIFFLIYFALDWFYHVFFDIFFRGQSPGKRILGLRVVLNDGAPVSAGASFIRNLLRFVDGYIGLYLIAFLSASASRAFRRPGDWAAGTLVIYTWQSGVPGQPGKMDWLSGLEPILPEKPLSYEEKQGILMFARRFPLLGKARADEIAGPLAASLQNSAAPFAGGASAYLLGIARSFAGER
jgi:uncharacterized RDD family membrane protein YckC